QFILDLSKGDIELPSLTPHQQHAADGTLATAMASYIAWIAPRYEEIQNLMKQRVQALRASARSGRQHARTPGIVANLQFGFMLFLLFARRSGAITEAEQTALREECWSSLLAAAERQEVHQQTSDPPLQFMRLLASAIGTGRVHIGDASQDGPPADASIW